MKITIDKRPRSMTRRSEKGSEGPAEVLEYRFAAFAHAAFLVLGLALLAFAVFLFGTLIDPSAGAKTDSGADGAVILLFGILLSLLGISISLWSIHVLFVQKTRVFAESGTLVISPRGLFSSTQKHLRRFPISAIARVVVEGKVLTHTIAHDSALDSRPSWKHTYVTYELRLEGGDLGGTDPNSDKANGSFLFWSGDRSEVEYVYDFLREKLSGQGPQFQPDWIDESAIFRRRFPIDQGSETLRYHSTYFWRFLPWGFVCLAVVLPALAAEDSFFRAVFRKSEGDWRLYGSPEDQRIFFVLSGVLVVLVYLALVALCDVRTLSVGNGKIALSTWPFPTFHTRRVLKGSKVTEIAAVPIRGGNLHTKGYRLKVRTTRGRLHTIVHGPIPAFEVQDLAGAIKDRLAAVASSG